MNIQEFKHYFLIGGVKVHWNFKLLPDGFEAITLFGHVFDIHKKEDLRSFLNTNSGKFMVNHERIHIIQAESFKLRYFTFYIVYVWYWVVNLFKYGAKNNIAYYNIPFEREAYDNECNFDYKSTRWKDYKDKK